MIIIQNQWHSMYMAVCIPTDDAVYTVQHSLTLMNIKVYFKLSIYFGSTIDSVFAINGCTMHDNDDDEICIVKDKKFNIEKDH